MIKGQISSCKAGEMLEEMLGERRKKGNVNWVSIGKKRGEGREE